MVRYSKKKTVSPQTQDEALKIASEMHQPGQTKEQTKLIAQGIQKGIEQYKKQQKAKARELNKKLRQVGAQQTTDQQETAELREVIRYKRSLTPWILLILSWGLFAAYIVWNRL